MTKPVVLDADEITNLIGRIDLMGELRTMFGELGCGEAIQPAQTLTDFPDGRGDFITYMGAQTKSGVFGAKLSPYLVTEGKPVITAWTMLMSMDTGQPLLLCDAGQLTTERTAGTTALAVDYLANPKSTSLAIIGSGPVAIAHWRHVQNLRNWESVRVYSPSLANDEERRVEWTALCPNVEFVMAAEAAAMGADVVMLCTSSSTPVVDMQVIGDNTLLTSISTNVANAHEVSSEFLSRAQVYCDYRETAPLSAGEMVLAARDHGWSADMIVGDLPELSTTACPTPAPGKPIFFRSIGLGLEDLAAAKAVLEAVRNRA